MAEETWHVCMHFTISLSDKYYNTHLTAKDISSPRISVMIQLGGELQLFKAHIVNLCANISQSVVWEFLKQMSKTLGIYKVKATFIIILRYYLSFLQPLSYESIEVFSRGFMICDDITSLVSNRICAFVFYCFLESSMASPLGFSILECKELLR